MGKGLVMLLDHDHYMARDYISLMSISRSRGDHNMAAWYWERAKFRARLWLYRREPAS
jgi:hypothetical protein